MPHPFRPGPLFAFFVSIMIVTGVQAKTLVLNNVGMPPFTNDHGTGFLDVIGREAFRRSGVELSLIKLPAERGLMNANAGIDDGEFMRVSGLQKLYPNLIQVPEKLFDIAFVAFSKDPAVRVAGWADLRNYSVGFIKGWKIFEKNTPKGTRIIYAQDAKQLFDMLEKDRVEVVLYSRLMGLENLRRRKLTGVRDINPPLAVRGLYIYLNKRHRALAAKISDALAAMKAEGLYDAEYAKVKALLELNK